MQGPYKFQGVVHMKYWIYCDRHVDRIGLRAFIREGDRWSDMQDVVCRNTYVCEAHETLPDRPGSQREGW